MKRLICYTDIKEAYKQGENYLVINDETIVTPLAKDLIEEYKMEIRNEEILNENSIVCEDELGLKLSKESFVEILRKVLTEGNRSISYFDAETHKNGLKVVKGESVKLSRFDTGKPNDRAYSQELIGNSELPINAGILEMNQTSFNWELEYNEINYVISGSLSLTIDGQEYHAQAGDTIYIPNKSKITWNVPEKTKLFYVTCPTNLEE